MKKSKTLFTSEFTSPAQAHTKTRGETARITLILKAISSLRGNGWF